jgi:tripartite-type tricarboxylate transporter receptor subunit TctC
MVKRYLAKATLGLAGLLLAAGTAVAQNFPTRPITLVCPFPPGASADAALRALATAASKELGQQIIVENKPGVAGTLGASSIVNAKPDGYTLSQVTNTLVRQPFIGKTNYDVTRNFTYVLGVTAFEFGLAVRADAPWKSFQELIAYAKKHPGLNYGTSGVGAVQHQIMQRIGEIEQINWTHVPYKGQAPAMTDLEGGHLDLLSDTSAWAPFVDAGNFRLLAVYNETRLKRWPNVPTLKELGYDLADSVPWGIVGPAGMDPAIVKRLDAAFRKAMQDKVFLDALAMLGQEPRYLSSDDYRKYMLSRIPIERDVVEKYNLRNQ